MGYKLIALDVDGTIRSDEHPLSQATRTAIEKVHRAGAVVTLATGRMFTSAQAAALDVGINGPIISSQGAHIANPISGDILWHRPLTPAMARDALHAIGDWQQEILAYHDDLVYVERLSPWVEAYGERNRGVVNLVESLEMLAEKMLTRLVLVGDETRVFNVYRQLTSSFGSELHVTRSLPHFCEILHSDAGKHNALAWLCKKVGARQDETVAFGNGYNDVDMLRWAGLGIAVSGAVSEVIQVADQVAPPLEEDGPASVMEELLRLGLIG